MKLKLNNNFNKKIFKENILINFYNKNTKNKHKKSFNLLLYI